MVTDVDFMNLVKVLDEKRTAELYCFSAVEVLELSWDETLSHDIFVVGVVEIGKHKENVDEIFGKTRDKEIEQKSCYTVEIYDETLEVDELYVTDEVGSESAYVEIEVNDIKHNYGRAKAQSPTTGN